MQERNVSFKLFFFKTWQIFDRRTRTFSKNIFEFQDEEPTGDKETFFGRDLSRLKKKNIIIYKN